VPFTLSHGAAALPFQRLRLVTSALLIGTFAPDFEYFLRLEALGRYGHTPEGALLFTLPVALVVLWLFHAFVKVPAARLLPDGVQRRLTRYLGEFRFGGAQRFLLIVFSTLLGIATHLFWDAFTHRSPAIDDQWPVLNHLVRVPLLGWIPYYRVLQHVSTILGVAALSLWLLWWYRTTEPSPTLPQPEYSIARRLSIIGVISGVALLGGYIRARLGSQAAIHHLISLQFLAEFVVTTVAFAWWQLVAFGMYVSSVERG
jgi:hypothetical protein